MAEGPAFTKKETEIGKLSCESRRAGKRSSLEASPPYINMSTARPSMMVPPSCPAPSVSPGSSLQQQQQQSMISSCSPKINNLEGNTNPNPNNPSHRSTLLKRGENHSGHSSAPFLYRHSDPSDGSFPAEQSQAAASWPYSIPTSNIPNPNPNHKYPALNPNPYPSPNLSTAHPPLVDDRLYSSSPLHHLLLKNERQLPDQSLFDPDHQSLSSTDDHLIFGGFRLLSSHVSSPLFSEGLQPSTWSPAMITDFPFMSTHREAPAALLSPAPEITGIADLQDAEMSLFSSSITPRRWSLYDDSSSRKGLLDTSELPSTAASTMDPGTQNQPSTPIIGAQDDFPVVHQSPAHDSPSFDDTHFVGKSTASASRSGAAGGGFSGGESEVVKHASPATDMSSSSASELQDEEDSNITKPVGTQENSDKPDGGDAPDLGKPEANVDNKPSKKPRKKGQRRVREARVALVTKSEVEHLEDGYRWRKYGQKAVKNSPHPRSYYRCTNSKCFVKKRVERCNEDPSLVVTTYEGQHTHHSPAVLRGSHDHMLDPLISGPLGTLNYHRNIAAFIPWQSSIMQHPTISTPSPSHFPPTSIGASFNQLFRPLHPAPPSLLLSKPLSFPTTPSLSLPTATLDQSNSLPRHNPMHPPHLIQAAALPSFPRPLHVVQTTTAAHHDQLPQLSSPTLPLASPTLPSSHVDKGLLDDMLSHASARKPSTSSAPT